MTNTIKLYNGKKIPGWFSEPKNMAITVVVVSILAYKTYLFITYVLPWLVTLTWNLVNLVIAGVVLGFLLMIITSKKFWRALKYFSEFIANYTIGLAIELNPFKILEYKIEQGFKDRDTLYKQGAKLKGKHISNCKMTLGLSVFNYVCPNIFFIFKFVEETFKQNLLFGDFGFGIVKFACEIFGVSFKFADALFVFTVKTFEISQVKKLQASDASQRQRKTD